MMSGKQTQRSSKRRMPNVSRRFSPRLNQNLTVPASPLADKPKRTFNLAERALVGAERNSRSKLRIIPLGGQEEVGRNCTLFEYEDSIIMLDAGLQFPEENMPGIDYIIPDTNYLKGKEKNVRAILFSHGHLDHIGAAPFVLEKLNYPIIAGRPLTLAMVKHRQEDYKPNTSKNLKTIEIKGLKDVLRFGPFTIKFFQVEHSVMDAVGVIIETPVGTIIHPGDWTLEKDAKGQPVIDYTFLRKLPKRPTILMLESLGATDVRPSASSQDMEKNLTELIKNAPSRLLIGTFASQIERIGWIIETAERFGKKVALDGFSMKVNVELAKKFGYIKARKGTLIKIDQIDSVPDNKLVIIATGAQGESNAVLSRIIAGSHRFIKVRKTDTIVFSSSIIPGNERTIQTLKDGLYRQCDNVIHGEIMDIHVSGHGNRDDIAFMLDQIRPDYFFPVYAYHYMLKEAAKLAISKGWSADRVVVLDNGQVGEVSNHKAKATTEKVSAEYVFVDGLGVGDISDVVLRDRKMMGEDGMLVVIATIRKKTGQLVQNPDIISRGFIYMKENKQLVEDTRGKVKQILKESGNKGPAQENYLRNKIRNDVGDFLWKKTNRRPMVIPVLIEV